MSHRGRERARTGPLDVVFVGGYDSTNHAYVELAARLAERGHRVRIVVGDPDDRTNLFMFDAAGIATTPVSDFRLADLDVVDFVIAGPFMRRGFETFFTRVSERGVFLVTIANLFGSATMWTTPDLVLCSGEGEFAEFSEQGLAYRMVAIGNPQYDGLLRAADLRRATEGGQIRSVLFVDQGAYPVGPTGKRQLAESLEGMARRDPDLSIHVKPRYAPNTPDHLHAVSDHLFEHLANAPDNIVLLDTGATLEEVLPRYDAMMTMFSTAHLGAAALGIPMLLLEGLDSIDVFDIRRQVVRRAFDRMRGSGCVVDVAALDHGAPPFRPPLPAYVESQLYRAGSPAAPRVIDLLERLAELVVRQGRSLRGSFQLTYDEMVEGLDRLETTEREAAATLLEQRWRRSLNAIAQRLALENRSCGYVFDTSVLAPFWDRRVGPDETRRDVASLVVRATDAVREMEAGYFDSHPREVETDAFVQDAYFNHLCDTRQLRALSGYSRPVVAPASLQFALGRAYAKRGRLIRALGHTLEAFDLSLRKPMPTLRLDKNVRSLMQLSGRRLDALGVLVLMSVTRRYEALAGLDVPETPGLEALAYHKVRALRALGKRDEALEVALRWTQEPAHAQRAGRGVIGRAYRNRLRHLADRLREA